MRHLEFNPLLGIIIFVVGVPVVFGIALDACLEDEGERDDLGWRTEQLTARGDEEDDKRRRCKTDDRSEGSCNEHRDCDRNTGSCSDDDFSPSFDESPIVICVQPDSCRFEGVGFRTLVPAVGLDDVGTMQPWPVRR